MGFFSFSLLNKIKNYLKLKVNLRKPYNFKNLNRRKILSNPIELIISELQVAISPRLGILYL